ncbi:hypothetical protein RDI58_003843 [Solanum bulbocastanum]|uniref:Uncharacterized protein n=1 Tax=Solanum bulbocastanum TaxID=147425 RepID=A0AAN8U5C5_SOLBU
MGAMDVNMMVIMGL